MIRTPLHLLAACFFIFASSSLSICQWQSTNGPFSGGISTFAQIGDTLFAGGSPYVKLGVYRSIDQGKTWDKITNGLSEKDFEVNSLYSTKGILLAGCTTGKIYRSSDRGDTWTDCNIKFGTVKVFASNDSLLFAACGTLVIRSTDIGKTWSKTSIYGNLGITSLVIIGDKLFTGNSRRGIYSSSDWGDSWIRVNNNFSSMTTSLFNPIGTLLFASADSALYRSIDEGNSWTLVAKNFSGPLIWTMTAMDQSIFIGGYGIGMYRSDDLGVHWQKTVSTLTDQNIFALASDGMVLLAGTYSNWIARSLDGGVTWTESPGNESYALPDILSSNSTQLFSGSNFGIHRFDASEKKWIPRGNAISDIANVSAIVATDNVIVCAVGQDSLLYRSTSNGDSWELISGWPRCRIDRLTTIDGIIYGGGSETGSPIIRSSDLGVTWGTCTITSGGSGPIPTPVFYSIKKFGKYLIASGAYNSVPVARSEDNGLSWYLIQPSELSQNSISILALSTIGPTLIAACDYGGRIYQSIDTGSSWNKVYEFGNAIYGMVEYGNDLFIATETGIFSSSDLGATWSSKNDGLHDTAILALALLKDNLYISTESGVYRRPRSELSVKNSDQCTVLVNDFTAFPNPFTTETSLTINCPESMSMQFEIYDILGKKIYDGGEKLYSKGENAITLNTSNFSDGFLYGRFTSSIGDTRSITLFKSQSQR